MNIPHPSTLSTPRNFPANAPVTGGTKGIGEAILDRLVRGGATVIATARATPSGIPSSVEFIAADISTVAGTDEVITRVLARYGGLDIIVNNVGGSSAPGGGALALTDIDWQNAIDVNLLATVRARRGFLPSMVERPGQRAHFFGPAPDAALPAWRLPQDR